ncbi:MAG TPA: choice-of-anchor L domain-containing protein [Flavobacterium sp.]|nr:choice-of-anchor L domain-containing protein [Flavobacterium sp.]
MKNITFCILMLYGFAAQAQLIVSNTVETPAQLVQNVLVDASVTPTNLKFNNSPANANIVRDQAGHFTTNFNPTNLGLSAGVMLSTGKSQMALGPNDQGGKSIPSAFATYTTDADLASLTTNSIGNAVVLEFDFVATGLELNFDYVFASEEYPEFTNSGFNDVFGFFLSGPGLSGPYSGGAVNIALVPSTTVPITINNVNNGGTNTGPCEYCTYYVNNGTGTTPLANPSIQYDGFTTVLRATSALVCGQTYHIKLAIANVGDNAWDSAVFLKNFKIKPLELLANNSNVPICPGVPVTITSGIDPEDFIFVWTKDTAVLPGENQPTLNIPASNTVGGLYTLTYYTASGCLLGTADFNLTYYPDPLTDPTPINLCTPLPPPYDLNDIDPTAEILNGTPAINYDIHYYYTQAEAEAPVPTAGIPISVLNDFQLTTTAVTIWGRFEDLTASGCIFIKQLVINAGTEPSGTFSYPGPFCDNPSAAPVLPNTTVTPGGTYNTSSAGLIVNPTNGEIDLALSSPGNYTVNYHLPASGTCPDFDVNNIPVVITTAPVVPIVTSPVVYCQGETAAVLTAAGTNLLWYTSATGGTGDPIAPTPSTLLPGNTDYYVSQSNGCEGGRSVITVNVNPVPAAPTFTAVAPYCQNAPALPLTANGTNLLWYTTATGGVGNAVAPTPLTTTAGNITYYVTQTVSNCESARAAIAITTIALPAAPTVTSPIGYCQNDAPAALTATGSNLLWYAAATGGVGNATAPLINTAPVSSTTYYVSQTVSGCEGPRAAITVNVTTVPAAPGVSTPLTYCQNETAAVLSATGTNLLWYAAATGGTGNAVAPTPSTIASGSTLIMLARHLDLARGRVLPLLWMLHQHHQLPELLRFRIAKMFRQLSLQRLEAIYYGIQRLPEEPEQLLHRHRLQLRPVPPLIM